MAMTRPQIQSEAASRRATLQKALQAGMAKEPGGMTQAAFNAAIRAVDDWENQQYRALNAESGG